MDQGKPLPPISALELVLEHLQKASILSKALTADHKKLAERIAVALRESKECLRHERFLSARKGASQ